MAKSDIVRSMVEPLAAAVDAGVYDVTFNAGKLSVAITGRDGVDLETLTTVSRQLSEQLDERDVIGGSYTLEVTSPGLERPLRTPEHYWGAIGEAVTVRTTPDTEGDRRVRGTVSSADDDGFTVAIEDDAGEPTGDSRTLSYDQVERARTTFVWGPSPKPGKKPGSSKKTSGSGKKKNTSTTGKKAPST
jgi:ribosome maturation factor RimP